MDGAIIYRTKKFENLSGSADCEGDADGQLRLITDSNYALTGELQDKETSTCLYSANPNLVRLLKDALANETRLIEIEKKMLDINGERNIICKADLTELEGQIKN